MLKDDEDYLLRLTKAIDELDDAIMGAMRNGTHKLDNCWCRVDHKHQVIQLGVLREYFLYLTLDALEDPDVAHVKMLVSRLERCEFQSKTNAKFFFALAQLLSVKHEIVEVPGERISREEFEESWQRTARELGLDSQE